MSLSNVFAVLQQYAGGAASHAADPLKDFDQVAQNASQSHLATGLAGAIRSDAPPSFAQTISTLFSNSDPQQKSGILSHLLGAAGPAAATGAARHVDAHVTVQYELLVLHEHTECRDRRQ